MKEIISIEVIEKRIYLIRRHKVMIDRDLAELYGGYNQEAQWAGKTQLW